MTTTLITRPVTIASLKADNKAIHNGRKAPTATDIDSTKVRNLTTATLKGNKVSNQARKTTKNGHTVTEHTGYSYKELQAVLKGMGLRANGSTDVLQARLERARTETLTEADYPKAKPSAGKKRAKATPAPKRTAQGMDYRSAQRFVKWAKDNLVGYTAPCKNTGWDNVAANIDAILDNAHFWELMNNNNDALAAAIKEHGASF